MLVSYKEQYSRKKSKGNIAYQKHLNRERSRYHDNKEIQLQRNKKRYEEKRDTILVQAKQYREKNKGKRAAWNAKRRCQKILATPVWYKDEKEAIKQIYEEAAQKTNDTGIAHQVDHIVPLLNKRACGLHCLANLQIITAQENVKKHNALREEIEIGQAE